MSNDARRRRPHVNRHVGESHPSFDGWVRLESSGWYVQVSDIVAESRAAELVADDTVWSFAVADWLHRRPSCLHRTQRRAWRDEEAMLAAQAALLVEASTHLRTLRPISDARA